MNKTPLIPFLLASYLLGLSDCNSPQKRLEFYPYYNQRLCGTMDTKEMREMMKRVPVGCTDKAFIYQIDCLNDSSSLQLWNMSYSVDSFYYPCTSGGKFEATYLGNITFMKSNSESNRYFLQSNQDFKYKDSLLSFFAFVKEEKVTHLLPDLIDKVYCPHGEVYLNSQPNPMWLTNFGFTPSERSKIAALSNPALQIYQQDDGLEHSVIVECIPDKLIAGDKIISEGYLKASYKNMLIIAADPNYSQVFVQTGRYQWDSLKYELTRHKDWKKLPMNTI